ncbi:MAG: tetratricopeptide repeat protein [Treponemataceae bacterium]
MFLFEKRTSVLLLVVFVSIIFSCKAPPVSASFSGRLNLVDAYITQFKMTDAVNLLKKLSKKASSAQEILSVYTRCNQLGENKLAKQTLQHGYKAFPQSIELQAVYAQYLINQQSFDEAFSVAKNLEGTHYGSLYSELLFRMYPNQDFFLAPSFLTNFIDAANTTKNSLYLQNAAVIKALNGNLQEAIQLHPHSLASDESPLFWAKLSYDTENYFQSLLDISASENPSAEILLLKADILLRLGKVQDSLQTYISIYEQSPNYSPVPYLNIAFHAHLENNWDREYAFLYEAVEKFPLYLPALGAYAELALFLNQEEDNDILGKAVRASGLQTLRMKDFDMRPRILLSDPLARLMKAYEVTEDERLLVEIYKYSNAMKNISPSAIRQSEIWEELEKEPHNEYLLQYFVWVLMWQKEFESAGNMFFSYFYDKYGVNTLSHDIINQMQSWEKEYFAYFYAQKVPSREYMNYEMPLTLLKNVADSNNLSEIGLFNLAVIFESSDDYDAALAQYAQLSSMQTNAKLKSEAQYRMARIYTQLRDFKKADLSLNYSLELNPANNKARLFRKQNISEK